MTDRALPNPPPGFLLDTGVLIDAIGDPGGPLAARVRSVPRGDLFVSAMTVSELRIGPLLSRDPAGETAKVDAVFAAVTALPFDDRVAEEHARMRAAMNPTGLAFQAFDSIIAATARAHRLTLVTRDAKMLRVLTAPKATAHVPAFTDWQTP